METSLHRQIKDVFGVGAGGRTEVVLHGFRIDAVSAEGELIEVQSGALGPLRGKLRRLLAGHRVRVIKPVVLSRRLVRRARRDGADLSSRLSPKRGAVLDVFDDLIGLRAVFPHPNLSLEVWGVEIDEVRIPRRRWPGYVVVDRRLRAVAGKTVLRDPAELWGLLPSELADPFTTSDLADSLRRPLAFAQRVAYCLRHAGAARSLGKRGRFQLYARGKA
ncbi:MAG: hypothetical protein P4L84_22600 [Isosphaeraceae bacterium]|nr:hypothetical protein [Isosphaeraceae bacterium]